MVIFWPGSKKIEGQKYNVFSSAVAPVALSRMTDSLFPEGIGERFLPEYVTPAVIYLASEESENGAIIGAGAVVTKDVDPGKTVVGIPARDI